MRSLGLAAAFLAMATSPAAAQEAPDARAQAVYAASCAVCHSAGPAAPVGDLTRRAPADYEAFAAAVRNGDSPSGEMPAFSAEIVSDADLRALHAYIMRVRAQR